MPTKTPTLEQLEQEQAEAMARVEAARTAANHLRQQAEQRRADAQHEHDEAILRDWRQDRQALEDDITAARQRLRAAVFADPVWNAYRDLVLAGHRLTTRSLEYYSTSSRIRGPQAGAPSVPTLDPPAWEELARIVADDAQAEGREQAAARDEAREDVGTAAYGKA